MGSTLQIMIKYKCCNDDLEIDNDDNEKPLGSETKPPHESNVKF